MLAPMKRRRTIDWTPEAAARLEKVPFFVRPFVKRRAEAAAAEHGLREVDSDQLDAVKEREHRG